jgi:hypothetical protein
MPNSLHRILLTVFAAALSSCIDANPSVFTRPGADASTDVAPPPDDSGEAGDPNAACRACFAAPEVPGPGCDKFAECQTQPTCLDVFECGFQDGCWSKSEQAEVTTCAVRCIGKLGLGFDNPGVQTIVAMGPCLNMQCRPFCHGGASWPPGGADPNAACRSCFAAPEMPGPGCGEKFHACSSNTNCKAIFECGITNGCWAKSAPAEANTCGTMCIGSLGVPFDDPGVGLLLAMQPCLFGASKPFCSEGAPWPPQ